MRIVKLRMYVIVTFTILAVCMTAKADGYERGGCLVNWTPGTIVQGAQTRSGATDIAYGDRGWDAGRKYRQLVVLLSFTDCDFSTEDARSTYDALFNSPGYTQRDGAGCVADYFRDQSGGRFNLQFDVYGPYKTNSRVKTGTSTRNEGHTAFREATRMLMGEHPEIDYSVYDWDGDGAMEQVVYVYAGYNGNQSTIKNEGYIWPTTGTFSTLNTPDGYRISNYTASGELWTNNKSSGIGLICHEFSHCLYLPDIYPTSARVKDLSIVDEWDLMDGGPSTNYGWCPPNYSPLEKMIMGWLTPTVLTEDTTVTGIRPVADGGTAYMIRRSDEEFYLLENRQRRGWDYGLPGNGLVVYRVHYDRYSWRGNSVNNEQGNPNYCLVPADGKTFTEWYNEILNSEVRNPYTDTHRRLNSMILSGAPYPWHDESTSINEVTLFDGKAITDITQHEDGTVSFRFRAGNQGSGLEDVRDDGRPDAYYNLQGQRVGMLRKGRIYINNGRKFVQR